MAAIIIGKGGTGPDPTVPECPICYASGGGGHGGFCPNAKLNEGSWLAEPPAHMDRPNRDSPRQDVG